MNKGANGVGSASIVLIFAVLCLTIFALITFSVAEREKVLIEREAALVIGYYHADAIAEIFLAELLAGSAAPDTSYITDKTTFWCDNLRAEIIDFSVEITDTMQLAVSVAVEDDYFHILSWKIRNIAPWTADNRLNVWLPPGPPG